MSHDLRARNFAADTPADRRDDALIALVGEGLSASEISELVLDDIRLFDDSVTVRIANGGAPRYARVRDAENVRALRTYIERDLPVRRLTPLFPGRSPIRGMTVRHLHRLLVELREPSATARKEHQP